MPGGERHSPPRTLHASLLHEMKGKDGDDTGIPLFISLIKYKGLFERVQRTARHAELGQVPAFAFEKLTSETAPTGKKLQQIIFSFIHLQLPHLQSLLRFSLFYSINIMQVTWG